ncbi:MAG: hypothetical protein ACRDGR_00780, partial [bacterium]
LEEKGYPTATEETRWIVEILGTVTHEISAPGVGNTGYYMTGLLVLVGDGPAEFQGAVFMP